MPRAVPLPVVVTIGHLETIIGIASVTEAMRDMDRLGMSKPYSGIVFSHTDARLELLEIAGESGHDHLGGDGGDSELA